MSFTGSYHTIPQIHGTWLISLTFFRYISTKRLRLTDAPVAKGYTDTDLALIEHTRR